MSETERITVGETVDGEEFTLPVVDVLTGRGFATGKSGSGKSVLEGTTVYTDDGRKPIEEVQSGERVLSLNKHRYEQEFREVQATIEHESSELLRITLEDGTEVVGTEDHSFLTVDDLEIVPIRGENLEEGTWLPLSRELPSTGSVERIDLAEYVSESRDLDINAETIRSGQKTDDRYFDLDFPSGKVVGLFLAEGSFDDRLTVQISNVDDDVKEFLADHGFSVYNRTCDRSFKPFGTFLETEFGRGAGGKSLPNWVYDAPKDFRAGLLSGYLDGDGTVEEHTVTVMSKSDELIEGIAELLRQFGISSTVREKLSLYEGERRSYRRLRVDAFCIDDLAQIVDLTIQDKAEKLETISSNVDGGDRYNSKDMIPGFGDVLNAAARERGWTQRESDRRTDGASLHHLTRQQKAGRETYNRYVEELGIEGRAKQFGESDIQWKRVVDVEQLEETRTVYDLDVRLNDNFVANGVFVHNSNTASVVLEELLDAGLPAMVVDTDGEYYGLKEEYELLHAGADEECDIRIGPEHAERMATLALEENVPIILDVSGYLDEDEAGDLIRETARQLFAKEKKLKKPFLLVVEECHEFIPEGGGMDETGKMLVKIGKRGRKHGLGLLGISQRPADVKKDFITQANWLVWHRLTWDNDTKVVGRVVSDEHAERVSELPDGRAFVQADWTESDVMEVQFRRKHTFDAGATPGLEDVDRPELKSVSNDLVEELDEISEKTEREQERIAELERTVQEKEARIEELEAELSQAQDVSDAARQMAAALTGDLEVDRAAMEERVMEKDREINRLKGEVSELEAERDELQQRVETLEKRLEDATQADLGDFEDGEEADGDGTTATAEREDVGSDAREDVESDADDRADGDRTDDGRDGESDGTAEGSVEDDERVARLRSELADRNDRIEDLEATVAELESALEERDDRIDDLEDRLADREERIEQLEDRLESKEAYVAALERRIVSGSDGSADGTESGDRVATANRTGADATAGDGSAGTAGGSDDDRTDDADGRSDEADEPSGIGQPSDGGVEFLENESDRGAANPDGNPAGSGSRDDGGDGDGTGRQGDDEVSDGRSTGGEAQDDEGVEVLERDAGGDPRPEPGASELVDDLLSEPVTERIAMAHREAKCNESAAWEIVTALATRGPAAPADLEPHTGAPAESVRSFLLELRRLNLVDRRDDGSYAFDRETVATLRENPQRVDGIDDPEFARRLE